MRVYCEIPGDIGVRIRKEGRLSCVLVVAWVSAFGLGSASTWYILTLPTANCVRSAFSYVNFAKGLSGIFHFQTFSFVEEYKFI